MSLVEGHSLLLANETTSHYDNTENTLLPDDDQSHVLIAKGVTMAVLCTVSTCMGILPMLLAKCCKWDTGEHVNSRYTRRR